MKQKILNLLLIVFSLAGYLEWGNGNHSFLFQAEWEVLSKIFSDPFSVIHPFTIIPMAGQLLLITTLFQKKPGKWLTYSGIGSIAILLLFILFIGIISLNIKIAASTLPFLAISVWAIKSIPARGNKPQK